MEDLPTSSSTELEETRSHGRTLTSTVELLAIVDSTPTASTLTSLATSLAALSLWNSKLELLAALLELGLLLVSTPEHPLSDLLPSLPELLVATLYSPGTEALALPQSTLALTLKLSPTEDG